MQVLEAQFRVVKFIKSCRRFLIESKSTLSHYKQSLYPCAMRLLDCLKGGVQREQVPSPFCKCAGKDLYAHTKAPVAGGAKKDMSRAGVDDVDSYADLCRFILVVSEKGGVLHFIMHARKCILKGLSPAQNRSIPPLRSGTVTAMIPTIRVSLCFW